MPEKPLPQAPEARREIPVNATATTAPAHAHHLGRGALYVLVGGAFWGISGTCSDVLMSTYHIQPLWLVSVRMFFAGMLLMAVATSKNRASVPRVFTGGRLVIQMLVTCFAGLMLNSIAYLSCIRYTDSGTATILQSLQIPLTLFWVCMRAHRHPRKRELIGLVLALIGVVLISTHGDFGAIHIPLGGLGWGLLCALGGTIAGIGNRRVLAERGTMPTMGVEMTLIGIVLAIFVMPWQSIPAFDAAGWVLLAFTIVFGTVCAFGLYYAGLRLIGPYRAGLLGTIEPVTATIASVVFLSVAFSPAELIGFAAIIVMVFLTS